MRLCRFQTANAQPRPGLIVEGEKVLDLSAAGVSNLTSLLEDSDSMMRLQTLARQSLPSFPFSDVRLLTPIEQQEVWAAGVTYLRSKKARMEESDFSANAYDRVYEAPRPELFFKALPEKVVSPGQSVGIRSDSRWSVPEPECRLHHWQRHEFARYRRREFTLSSSSQGLRTLVRGRAVH
jgi:2-dehydro-3-deoxy-D-arabinonate dehydratase